MAVDERSRHELYSRLEDSIGHEAAETLMEYLPPAGWAEVATKHDLSELERRMDLRFEAVNLRIEATEHRILGALHADLGAIRGEMVTRTQLFAMVGVLFAAWSLMLAALKLL
jgi:hypothetical protein